ncbi:MAG: hypothetical protein J1E82_01230 [Muribaculaceae bacterium]|nr:hypothetical protein [Muribaculaceae bacterium]
MRDIGKVNSSQVFGLWKNLTVCLLAVMATLLLSKILPYYLSPVIALLVASGLYVYIYNERVASVKNCMVPCITILYSIVVYAFFTIILNLMHIWGLFEMPHEFIFFTDPFIPALILNPVSFIVITWIYIRHRKLKMCVECRTNRVLGGQRGAAGLLKSEAHMQLRNFMILSGVLSVAIWIYYQFFYIDVNINARDAYIFTWLTVIGLAIDELYFSIRYYNLYLDLKENNELITPAELRDMSAKTYLRFYVVCGDYMYLTEHAVDTSGGKAEVYDTPFFTKQTMTGFLSEDVRKIITEMTGVDNGELRFFYGRKRPDDQKQSLLRYFYFLDGDISDYPELETKGEWVSFDKIKYIYSNYPSKMAELAVHDITRLATIILTEKIFNEDGYRKSGIKSYNPTFNLNEVRKSKIDFQDDKWIKISSFNSDTSFYKLKKWWKERKQKSDRTIG